MSLSASAVSSIAGITDVITSLVTVSSSNSQSPRASNAASSSVADSIAESSELVASSSPTPTLLASSVVASSENSSSTPSPAAASSAPAAASSPDNSAAITVVVTSVATLTDLPLTTIFTPPASCSTRPFTLAATNNSTIGTWDAQYNSTYACYPPSWNTAKVNYYLPGVCPEGYNYVGIFSYQTTTSANCCPYGMSLVDNNCQTVISTPTYALMPDLTDTFAISNGFTGLATPINVAWRSADSQSFTPAAAPVLAVASAWNLPTSTRTADTETSSAVLSSDGLSTGAKAGIGVGVAAAVLILLGILLFFFLRRRKQRAIKALPDEPEMSGKVGLGSTISSSTASSLTTAVSSPSTAQAHEIDPGSEVTEIQGNHISEAHGTNLVEMPVGRPCPELAGSVKPHELEAPWQFRVHELP
ncbi:hypothetical protein D6C86_08848 [Aureobasidium pullulans]|uniref:Uncharacterized protein n=1 Tax=Aureobasidium pullulans TaxID=5580 RepID=A0A4V4L3N2_AURPU|nr:hypothetical protein D6C94_09255 [Aureobasidium pullulans]THZ55165.1 hypothetical protein D6C86_08848 [Aureobasidium pullulans]THZ92866.1 hypothetical protein D6C88_02977 [Aureobasidium pullulans]